jgi:flagellar protein FlgJ
MTKQFEFLKKYLADARKTEAETGLHHLASLASSAVETGYGATIVGNMMHGVKDSDGVNGNEQLLVTTEYLATPTAKFPVIIQVKQVGKKLWKYIVKDYFRKFSTPSESFTNYASTIRNAKHFSAAWAVRGDYVKFFTALQAGQYKYATGADYDKICISVAKTFEQLIRINNL